MPIKGKLYLAHPMVSRQMVRAWETAVETQLGVELVNPFYDVDRMEIHEIDAGTREVYRVDPDEIVNRDLRLMKECDGIVAIIDGKVSYGTIMEICYAMRFCLPIFIICTNGHEKHPWLVAHSDIIFTSPQAFEEALLAAGSIEALAESVHVGTPA